MEVSALERNFKCILGSIIFVNFTSSGKKYLWTKRQRFKELTNFKTSFNLKPINHFSNFFLMTQNWSQLSTTYKYNTIIIPNYKSISDFDAVVLKKFFSDLCLI